MFVVAPGASPADHAAGKSVADRGVPEVRAILRRLSRPPIFGKSPTTAAMAETCSEAFVVPDTTPLDALLPQLLDELRLLARRELAHERQTLTLQTTDLIHEAYLRLAEHPTVASRGRAYFWGAAARAMRQVLIDAARRRRATKRGGGAEVLALDAVPADEAPRAVDPLGEDLIALDTALLALEARNPRQARVVECRYFGGMTVEDTAAALGVSARTVKSDWALARAWLRDTLRERADD